MKLFPFSAIVGQEKAKLALICNAIDPTIGGVLLSGDKGTGKSTMVRAFSQVLPEIEIVEGCAFNCNPYNFAEMCDNCREKAEKGETEIAKRKMRVIDLPLSVTLDRLVGTIDINRALKEGIRALQPGILAEANRNILYIDEVNLLEDYIADVLLDSAAMGWNFVEREGISLKHPSKFILVGSMNPEEGELRPQLLDRFGMFVVIEASNNAEERMEIVKRVTEFQMDPQKFYEKFRKQDEKLRNAIMNAKTILNGVKIDEELLKLLVETIIQMGIKTHRAEITTVKSAKAIAAFEGRKKVSLEDLNRAMELTLPHRIRSRPFQKPKIPQSLPKMQDQKAEDNNLSSEMRRGEEKESDSNEAIGSSDIKFDPIDIEMEKSVQREEKKHFGGRNSRDCKVTLIGKPIGIPISYMMPLKGSTDINFFATLNSAMLRGHPIEVGDEDLRINIRRARAPKLTAIILDSSGSMSLQKRISIAKGIAKKIVESSYQRRNLLSLIVFKGNEANVLVNPTRRYEDVFDAIDNLPTGGKTPLPSALFKLFSMAKAMSMKNMNVHGILITDGKANVPLFNKVEEDLVKICSFLTKLGVKLEIYDTRTKAFDPSPSYIELISQLTNAEVLRY
ncbi:MAG: VWA domain-containing protein [Archaeoglobaceae archaeon]|nr:VWA domain-containing protein [Archaeoglobaceae archaeon]MDW8118411.1 VWA domain-containing protein [Archaeoglobaceae archaeon]